MDEMRNGGGIKIGGSVPNILTNYITI